jgi:hypothetical protein
MKSASASQLDEVLNKVLPQVETNISKTKILSMVQPLLSYTIEDSTGFPFDHYEDDNSKTGLTCVVPVTLESNAVKLHQFLFPDQEYTPSSTVKEYSQTIIDKTGLDESDQTTTSDGGELPWNTDSSSSSETDSSSDSSGSGE